MAENEQLCKRSDGKGWRCRVPAMNGKGFCETHHLQNFHRHHRQAVPDHLKMDRGRRPKLTPKIEEETSDSQLGTSNLAPKRSKRKINEASIDVFDENPEPSSSILPRKRGKTVVKEENLFDSCEEQEKPSSSSSKHSKSAKKEGTPVVKIGASASKSVPARTFRSKVSPTVNSSIKSTAKNKKKCHWCRYSNYRVLVKCLACKKQFFCEDCVTERYHDKAAVKRECPVCLGTCNCRMCTRGKPKEVKTKEIVVHNLVPVVHDLEPVVHNLEPVVDDREAVVCNREKKFDKIKELHVVRMLLPLLEQINQEKIIELDIEAKNKGETHVQIAPNSKKPKCSFCKSWVFDLHRSCEYCPYILCVLCCQDFRNGLLLSNLEDLKNTKMVRSKRLTEISWKLSADGDITCPPENLGGCGYGLLNLTSFSAFSLTIDLEASAKQILLKYKFKKSFEFASSSCSLCEGNEEMGSEKVGNVDKNKSLYFLTKQDFLHKNLKHFMKHWSKGQPLIIRDVLKSQPELTWDLGFLLCTYLEKSTKGKIENLKKGSDWCDVQFGRKQVFAGGKTRSQEFLKFKVWFSSEIFQDQFPNHYEAVMQALPFQEYLNPLTGLLNLAVNLRDGTQNPNLGPFVYISYGGLEDLMQAEFLTKLSYHAYDVVNILAHATNRPISQQKLNKAKILMSEYNSQDHMKSSKKIRTRNKLEEHCGNSSDDTNNGEELYTLSDDSSSEDDLCPYKIEHCSRYAEEQIVDTCGAQWDIFCREDVPKLVEYLKKYSNDLNEFNGFPKKIFHPIFDEIFYLEIFDKAKLKEEFDVEPMSFEQKIGEAVFVPAGCPYQIKKTKSCVNVVLEFISPERASECMKLNNEVRQLPVNHKAKGKMLEVKKMAINGVHEAIEEIRKASEAETSDTPKE